MENSVGSDMFEIGKKFSSFKELQDAINLYEKNFYCNFIKRDSKKLTNVKRILSKSFNEDLIYYSIKYVCYFGNQYRYRSTGIRQKQSLKGNCPVHVYLSVSSDGQQLEVKSVNMAHNHETNEIFFRYLPPQRKLDHKDDLICELISLGANKKLLQSKLQEETGKVITLKSLHNAKTSISKNHNDMDNLYKLLKNDYNFDVKILAGEANNVSAILFLDEGMKKVLSFFPELLLVDATYKLLDSR